MTLCLLHSGIVGDFFSLSCDSGARFPISKIDDDRKILASGNALSRIRRLSICDHATYAKIELTGSTRTSNEFNCLSSQLTIYFKRPKPRLLSLSCWRPRRSKRSNMEAYTAALNYVGDSIVQWADPEDKFGGYTKVRRMRIFVFLALCLSMEKLVLGEVPSRF